MFRPLLFLVGLLLSSIAYANISIQIVPAWDGELRPGIVTELGIRVLSTHSGRVNFSVTNDRIHFTTTLDFDANKLKQEWLPIIPSGGSPLLILAHNQGREIYRMEIKSNLVSSHKRLVVIPPLASKHILTNTKNVVLKTTKTIYPDYTSLPHHFQAYDSIDALIIDETVLAHLDNRQLNALLTFVSNCGNLFILKTKNNLINIFKKNAGCGTRHTHEVSSLTEALHLLTLEHVSYNPTVIPVHDIQSITSDAARFNITYLLALLLGAYLLIILSLPIFTRKTIIPAFLIISMSCLMLLFFSNKRPEISLASWSEIYSGNSALRYSALLQVNGQSKFDAHLNLPKKLGLPIKLNSDLPAKIKFENNHREYNRIYFNTKLLSREQYLITGVVKHKPPLSIEIDNNRIIITNNSGAISTPAVLNWHDKRYPLPGLEPGEKWTPPDVPDTWPDNNIENIFRKTTVGTEAAILIRNISNLFDLENTVKDRQDWLIIRSQHSSEST